MKLVAALLVTFAIAILTIGCGGDGDEENAPVGGAIAATGPGLSIRQAIESDLSGPLLVNGFLLVRAGEVLFCSALIGSPPQCTGDSLKVEGLNLSNVEGLLSQDGVSWSTQVTQLLGDIDGDILKVRLDSTA